MPTVLPPVTYYWPYYYQFPVYPVYPYPNYQTLPGWTVTYGPDPTLVRIADALERLANKVAPAPKPKLPAKRKKAAKK